MRLSVTLILATLLCACAGSTSTTMVGEPRAPIEDWESVTFTFEMPEDAQRIAFLTAKSTEGFWPAGEPEGHSFTRLKKAAAKLGANVVVIADASNETGTAAVPLYERGTTPSGYIYVDKDVDVIEGTAIFVER